MLVRWPWLGAMVSSGRRPIILYWREYSEAVYCWRAACIKISFAGDCRMIIDVDLDFDDYSIIILGNAFRVYRLLIKIVAMRRFVLLEYKSVGE